MENLTVYINSLPYLLYFRYTHTQYALYTNRQGRNIEGLCAGLSIWLTYLVLENIHCTKSGGGEGGRGRRGCKFSVSTQPCSQWLNNLSPLKLIWSNTVCKCLWTLQTTYEQEATTKGNLGQSICNFLSKLFTSPNLVLYSSITENCLQVTLTECGVDDNGWTKKRTIDRY